MWPLPEPSGEPEPPPHFLESSNPIFMVRLALIANDIYVERVPCFWVKVTAYELFRPANLDTKIYLVQQALMHGDDFEFMVTAEHLLI